MKNINPGWSKINNKWHHYVIKKDKHIESHYCDGELIAQYYDHALSKKQIKELYNKTCK